MDQMALKNVYPVTTRLRKNGPKFTTMVTVDYAGVNIGDGKLVPDAEKSFIITAQNQWRRSGTIPKTFTIGVSGFVSGARSAHVNPVDVIAGMSDADLQRAFDAEMKRRTAEKSAAGKTGKRKPGKRHPAQPAATPSGTVVPPTTAEKPGDGQTA